MPTVQPRKRGMGYPGHVVSEKVKTGIETVHRSESPNVGAKVDISDQRSTCHVITDEMGGFKIVATETPDPKKGGCSWDRTWDGGGTDTNPYGTTMTTYTGCCSTSGKKGENTSINGASDVAKHNANATRYGNDGKTQSDLPHGGGCHEENSGNRTSLDAGLSTTGGAGNSTESFTGKKTINAEGGVGMGVNQGDSKKVYMRMEPDGTFHLQVTPAGPDGGKAIVKIDPAGNIKIISESTISIEAAQSMTIKTPTLNIKANIDMQGDFTQKGYHEDSSGPHCCG